MYGMSGVHVWLLHPNLLSNFLCQSCFCCLTTRPAASFVPFSRDSSEGSKWLKQTTRVALTGTAMETAAVECGSPGQQSALHR